MKESSSTSWRVVVTLTLIGAVARILVARVSDNIYWADEVFQVLEPAHRVVFGYGIIPWEFRFGIRSWIPPGFIAAILFVCKLLGLDQPKFYVFAVKLVLCIVASSVIPCSYVIAKNLGSENAGKLAAFSCAIWYELLYFAHKPLPGILATYFLLMAFACATTKDSSRSPILFGLTSGLTLVFRMHLTPVVIFIVAFAFWRWDKKAIWQSCVTLSAVFLSAGAVDYWTWGTPFISYYNIVLFNIVYEVSQLFGRQPFYWYFKALIAASAGVSVLAVLAGLLQIRSVWLILGCIGAILLAHSIIAHKEYRYVFAVIPFWIIIMSIVASKVGARHVSSRRHGLYYTSVATAFVAVSILGLFHKLPYERIVYPVPPLHKNLSLSLYSDLSAREDLVAVLDLSQHWWASGGYYYLHKDIPLYFPHHVSNGTVDIERLGFLVSHIITRTDSRDFAGFSSEARFGEVTLMRNKKIGVPLQIPDSYSKDILQKGVDDTYKPTVKPHL